jgi:hypothetical protein
MVGEEEKTININQVSAVMTDAHGPSAVISSLLRQVIGLVILVDLAMCGHTGHMCQIRQLLPSLAISCQTDYIFLMAEAVITAALEGTQYHALCSLHPITHRWALLFPPNSRFSPSR